MSGFLLDTNVLSEFSRKAPDQRVKDWVTAADDALLFTSALALAEIRLGIELLDPGKRRSELEQWFEGDLLGTFGKRVLAVNREIADRWAVLFASLQRQGRPLATIDGLIAATALEHGLTMVTRDVNDFAGTGVTIFNPWDL